MVEGMQTSGEGIGTMGRFSNSKMSYADYCETASETYFVDKSTLIKELIPALGKKTDISV